MKWLLPTAGAMLLALYPASTASGEQIGQWRLEIDPMTEPLTQLREEVARTGAPFTIVAASYDFKYDGDAPVSDEQKLAALARWSRVLVDALGISGLRLIDESQISAQERQQFAEMRQKFVDHLPFGMRAQMRDQMGGVVMLMDESMAPCTRIDGAYAAVLFTIQPRVAVTSEFGSIGMFVFGLGSCGERGGYAEHRLDYTSERVKRALVRDLRTQGADR